MGVCYTLRNGGSVGILVFGRRPSFRKWRSIDIVLFEDNGGSISLGMADAVEEVPAFRLGFVPERHGYSCAELILLCQTCKENSSYFSYRIPDREGLLQTVYEGTYTPSLQS
jgi:hypothetical protein